MSDGLRCKGCEAEYDSNVLGCVTCTERHYRRNYRYRHGVRPRPGTCAGCGNETGYEWPGCDTCRRRFKERRKRQRRKERDGLAPAGR